MRARRFFLILTAALLPAAYCAAQTTDDVGAWLSAGLEKKIAKGLSTGFEAEYRLQDRMRSTDRISAGASISYRLYRNKAKTFSLKAELGAKYMRVYVPESVTMKDSVFVWDDVTETDIFKGREYNVDESYAVNKFRATASVLASVDAGRWKFSLRERYQYTGNDSVSITEHKWRYSVSEDAIVERPDKAETEWKARNNRRHVLRSRLQATYDIPGCKLEPYASAELYNNLKEGMSLQKTRYMVGVGYTLRKSNEFKLYYAYQNEADDDEPAGHIIGLSYCYSF